MISWNKALFSCVAIMFVLSVYICLEERGNWLRHNKKHEYLFSIGAANGRKEKNDIAGAETILTDAIRKYPDHYEAYYELGLLLEGSGDSNLAYENYVKAYSLCGAAPTNIVSLRGQVIEKQRILDHLRKLTNGMVH